MRTTIRVDDELLDELKVQARKENVSLTRLINRTLKAGLKAGATRRPKRPQYRERTYALGKPKVPLDKALAVAAALEDEEIARKLMLRK
ncbi:MAG TPA: ribbon-helix-helix protein, CopG family [Casimicrobiaceae bacterium]|nr:ribbon-helix-helix protein, CopG family [Casimicrobiaceae bacterium]